MTATSDEAVPDAAVDAAARAMWVLGNPSAPSNWAMPQFRREASVALKAALPHLVAERDAEIARISANHMAAERLVAEGDRDLNERDAEIVRLRDSSDTWFHATAEAGRETERLEGEIEALKHDLALVMDAASEQATLATDLLAIKDGQDARIKLLEGALDQIVRLGPPAEYERIARAALEQTHGTYENDALQKLCRQILDQIVEQTP